MVKNFTFSFFLIYLLFSSFFPSYSQKLNAEQIYAKLNDAVVKVISYSFDGKPLFQGSGVIISKSGLVVTNYHNFKGAERIEIRHYNKVYKRDQIVGWDIIRDLLVVKLKGNNFPSINKEDLDKVKIGQKVFAIGSPLGIENTLSEGIVSNIVYDRKTNRKLIQITAPITHGSSGGAVFNERGQLIGISSYGYGVANLNYAIPVDEITMVKTIPLSNKETLKKINLFLLGSNARDAKFYNRSIHYFKKLLSIDSTFAPTYYNIALSYDDLDKADSSMIFCEQCIRKDPSFYLAYNELGYLYSKIGNYRKAEGLYIKAITLNPKFSDAYNNLGGNYVYMKNYSKAILYSQKALELNKYDEFTYNNIATAYKLKKNYNMALYYLEEGLEYFPNSDLCNYTLGRLYLDQGNYYKAIDCLIKVIKVKDNFLKAYIDLGNAYLGLKDYDNAIRNYGRVIYLYENQGSLKGLALSSDGLKKTYYDMGLVYSKKNNSKEAIEYFVKSTKIDTNFSPPYAGLAFIYIQEKDTSKILYYSTKAVRMDSSLWSLYYEIGNIYLNRGNYQQALRNFDNYFSHDKMSTKILYKIGVTYYHLNSFNNVKKFLNKLLSIDSTHSSAYNVLGAVYDEEKTYSKAIYYYSKAILYEPQNGGVYYNLGWTYSEIGNKEKSIEYMKKAVDLGYKPAAKWLKNNN